MNWKNWFRRARAAKQVTKSFRPSLESLEIRETPSISTTFSSGVLTIRESGTNAASQVVALIPKSSNSVQVEIGSTPVNVGTFNGVSSVSVTLGNGANDKVTLNDDGFSFAPNVTVAEGNGATDTVWIDGTGTSGTNILTGRLGVTQGLGSSDTIKIGNGLPSTGGIELTNTVTLTGGAGVGTTISLGGGATATEAILTGGITVTNAAGFTLALDSEELGNITVSNTSLGANATSAIDGTVGGNVTYTGGSGTDSLDVEGTVGGSLSFNGGANANTLTIAGTAAAFIGKTVTFTGSGADTINFGSAGNVATVGGNVYLNFGNAANTYNFLGAYVIGGNLSVTGGNTIAGNSLTLSSGTINGNVTVSFGNSFAANSFTISGTNVINGTMVSYTGGSVADTVTVSTAGGGYALNIYLKGGTDTVDLTNVTALGSLFISENSGATTSFTPPTAGYSYNVTFINWP